MAISVSVVIPNLDSPVVDRAVDAVCTQDGVRPDEILVVGRDTPGRLYGDRRARLIATDRPRLPGAARNIGMDASRGEVVVFVDADCVPETDWLMAHLTRLEAGETVVAGSVLWDDGPYWRTADNLSMFHEFSRWSIPGHRPYVPTLNLCVHRRVFDDVGPMDPDLPRGEDLDWSIRAARAGHRPYFEPSARLWHRPTRSSAADAWRHWHESGRWMVGVRRRHAAVFGRPTWLYGRLALAALAPLIAAYSTARLYGPSGPGRHYPTTLPAVYVTKLAWCLGAACPAPVTASGLGRRPDSGRHRP